MPSGTFDVIVVGGGHAGAEAAWAAARLGAQTALITLDLNAIGRLSCNPAIGGIGKGQMVREIDALGGLMGIVADEAGIQFRMLNRRKGPAMWAPRAQVDYDAYPKILRRHVENCLNLSIIVGAVESISTEPSNDGMYDQRVCGVGLADGTHLRCAAVIVTSGTFLRGLMHTGERQTAGGRIGEPAALGLSKAIERLGIELGRLKTGTPPRLARETIDFDALDEQHGDAEPAPFSFLTDRLNQEQVSCWITTTNAAVHDAIRANLHRAPMYSGQINSRGPRYCPSIEDKIVRFAGKAGHQVFLEPEGRDSQRIYANGISTSLPEDVQRRIVANIRGLKHARILQFGYAVEYDFAPPQQIDATMMTKRVRGLFLAGQVCGTSGYEEAAGQGLIAGINATRLLADRPAYTMGRDEGYIGVMIDDLVTQGVAEPYRMFTSRAEHRMHLRYDNADARLTPAGHALGLVSPPRWQRYQRKQARLAELDGLLDTLRHEGKSVREWLNRPGEDGVRFAKLFPELEPYCADSELWSSALVKVKYAGYIQRQRAAIGRMRTLEDRPLPPNLDYGTIGHLRREAVERLNAVRPRSIGQAARIAGVRPSDISLLLVRFGVVGPKRA